MIKKINSTLVLLTLGMMMFAKPFTPANPEAVVSVYANDKITWYGETDTDEGKGLLNLAARAAVNDKASDEQKAKLGYTGYLLEGAKDAVFEVFSAAGIELVSEETVMGSATYAAAVDNKMKKAAFFVTPENYKLFGNKDKQFAAIASETGAAGLVSVYFNIENIMDAGVAKNGKMKACCTVAIEFIDPTGKTLKICNGFATSNETVKIAGGVYDVEAVSKLFPGVIKASLENAVEKMKK